MSNELLTKEYIIQNGLEFEEHLEYGGPYDLAIVEYTADGKERLFTGLAYDLYENGNIESYFYVENGFKQGKYVEFYSNGTIKRVGHMNKNSADGYQVEFFENGMKMHTYFSAWGSFQHQCLIEILQSPLVNCSPFF